MSNLLSDSKQSPPSNSPGSACCRDCLDKGICRRCLGKGVSPSLDKDGECCWKCSGTGRCLSCKAEPVQEILVQEKTPKVQARDSNRYGYDGNLLAINSCPDCHGTLVCHKCGGFGSPNSNRCRCGEKGDCRTCRDHVATLEKFVLEMSEGSFGPAEAVIARGLKSTGDDEQSSKTMHSVGGVGIGALIGSFIFPGVGTVVGGLIGKAIGENSNVSLDWRRADLYFALGFLYRATNRKAEAIQAWIKALSLKEDHEPSRFALKQVF